MKKIKAYDIFISYRRDGGFEAADSIYQRLKSAGYSVFLDVEQLNSGKFNTKLLAVIEQCKDFIIVLPPMALDRCVNDDDWVRQEVEHAIKSGKNIVPIMLRGFQWPEADELPESMRELPNFNGISASDHNVFVENIERLKKNFLVSKTGFTWSRYKSLIISLVLVVSMVFLCGVIWKINERKDFEHVCDEVSMSMMTEMVKMHYNLGVAEDVYEAWIDYYEAKNKVYARDELKNAVSFYRKSLKEPGMFSISDEQKKILRGYGLELEEFEIFPQVVEMYYVEIQSYMDNILLLSDQSVSRILNNNARYGFESLKLSLKVDYYGMLGLYSTMSETIYDKVLESVPDLTYLSGIPTRLSSDEYDAMQQTALNEIEDVVDKMQGDLSDLKREVEAMENIEKRMEEEYVSAITEQKIASIEKKMVEVEKQKTELAELDMKLAEMYENALSKFALQPTDSQGIMWGKILRIAFLAEGEMAAEKQETQDLKELAEAAKKLGVSAKRLEKRHRTIDYHDMYEDVDEMLQKYEELNPAKEEFVGQYVAAARAYYKNVEAGLQNPRVGVILVATKDNEKHPVYEIGDIVTEKNGNVISTVSDYFAKSDVKEHSVKVLRLEDGKLKEMSLSFAADCPVLVGFSPLAEED